jgi:hypothetical protein
LRYADRLPSARPVGLRLTTLRRSWYRLDAEPPSSWSWTPFPSPRYRFDSASGASRVRYAGDGQRVAMRERFDESGRIVSKPELDLHLVELSGAVRVLDLRHDRTLDALALDDQISTSRAPGVWRACQLLSDRVHGWFGERCQGIVYRSRTTPQRSANLAFFAHAPLEARDLGRLGERDGLLAACVLSDGFTAQGWR